MGFNVNDILQIILNYIQYNLDDTKYNIIKIYEITSKYYVIVNNGIDSKLQIHSYICELFNLFNS